MMDKAQRELINTYFRKRSINQHEEFNSYELLYMVKHNHSLINTLSSDQIVEVISMDSSLISVVDLSRLDAIGIIAVLDAFPYLEDKFDYSKFNSGHIIVSLLNKVPSVLPRLKLNTRKLSGYDIFLILTSHPKTISQFSKRQLNKLNDEQISGIIFTDPSTIKYLNYKSLKPIVLLRLVRRFPELEKIIGTDYLSTFSQQNGLKEALEDGDSDELINLIKSSKTFSELREDPHPSYYSRGEVIELNISKQELIKILELGEQYESIESNARYSYNDHYNEDEANYMGHTLDEDNRNLIKKIARILGVHSELNMDDDEFWREEGKLKDFLEKYGLEKVVTEYIGAYADAYQEAEQKSCQELINQVPFDVDDRSFNINKMYKYYIENKLTSKNFDELIDDIKERLPYFSWEAIEPYENINHNKINLEVYNKLENILIDIEINEDNPYHLRAKTMMEAEDYLKKLGMKPYEGAIGQIGFKNSKAIITDIEGDEQDDETFRIMVTARIVNISPKSGTKSQIVRVPITSLKNYILQPQLKLNEQHLSLIKIMEDLEYEKVSDASPEMSLYKIGKEMTEMEEDQKFLEQEIEKVKNFNSVDDVQKYVQVITFGYLGPFNPSEPLRSICREKFQEIAKTAKNESEKDIMERILFQLEGPQKKFNIPDGAYI